MTVPLLGGGRRPEHRSSWDEDFERLVGDAERRAERIISLMRIAVAIGLALVFNVAVKGSAPPDDAMLAQQLLLARATIMGYAVIGLVSLALSVRAFHRRWFAFLFVTADVGFLVVSVDLALRNTGLEPRFMAAMPSAWLVASILAFGALRYSPRVQLYGTLLLAAGLLWISGTNPLSPVSAETGSPILPMFSDPANIMRVAMATLAGLVLVVAIVRARGVLTEAMRQERRRQSLTKYLPPEVARLVEREAADALRAGRRQHVVVAFVDIRDFTGRAERMAPEDVGRFLARFRAELREAAELHAGVIDKFIGDGAVVLFGVPDPREGDAARAVAFGREVLARMARWSGELAAAEEAEVRAGVGIHGGEVFVGAIGDDARLEFTVLGDVVNVAARVEEMTRGLDSDLVVTRDVLSAAREGAAGWRSVPAMPVRGRAEPVDVWALAPDAAAPRRRHKRSGGGAG